MAQNLSVHFLCWDAALLTEHVPLVLHSVATSMEVYNLGWPISTLLDHLLLASLIVCPNRGVQLSILRISKLLIG